MPVVDTSIYNSKGIDPGQLADGYEQGVKIKDMQQQQQLRGIQIQQATAAQNVAQGDLAFQKKLSSIAQTDPTTGQITYPAGSLAGLTQEYGAQRTMPAQQAQNEQAVKYAQQQGELLHAKLGEKQQLLAAAAESPAAFETAKKTMFDKGYIGMTDPLAGMSYEQATAPSDPANPKSGTFLENRASLAGSFQDQIAQKNKAAELANSTTTANAAATKAGAAVTTAATGKAELGIKREDLDLKRKELYGETPKVGASGEVNDPSILVPHAVPKAQQQKVYEEIKNAQDINSLSPKIMAAFDKGSSRNPVLAAQGQREFEGLINTTVKEQEGTARQAAFDSIHEKMTPGGTFAIPGDNDAKRRTVLEYLASKAAAPVAKSHGIDLSKYPTTALDAKTLGGQQASASAIKAPVPGTIEQGHVYVGGDPANPKSWVKQ